MTPWREQLRLGWRILRWAYWPPGQRTWANAAGLIVMAAAVIAVLAQIWLGLLAAFFLWFAIGFAGSNPGSPGDPGRED